MPVVDDAQKAAMARMMAIVNGAAPGPAPVAVETAGQAGQPRTIDYSGPPQPDVGAMKDILAKFYSASSNAAVSLTEDARSSSIIREALVTDRTPRGAKVGSWEIQVTEINDKLRMYDVCNVHTGEAIATDLRLYEAAHALVKLFNAGVGVNTEKVREVLTIEETYSKHYQDAVSFRHKMTRMTQINESMKAAVAEDRYVEARQKALAARDRLRSLSTGY